MISAKDALSISKENVDTEFNNYVHKVEVGIIEAAKLGYYYIRLTYEDETICKENLNKYEDRLVELLKNNGYKVKDIWVEKEFPPNGSIKGVTRAKIGIKVSWKDIKED